jgi:molybdate transport system substrate-binding protein
MQVLSTLALKGVLDRLRAEAERAAGPLTLRFDATQAILAAVAAGARPDCVIVTQEAIEGWRSDGFVTQARELGTSGVGIAVRAGAPKPDISTVDTLTRSLLAARSVARSKVGASGLYFAEVLQKLGIADRLQKLVIVEKGPVGRVVAAGEAELGVQQLCELAPVPGIDIVGPLPDAVQRLTSFWAGIPAKSAEPKAAAALLDFLGSLDARSAMLQGGLVPAAQ